MNNQYIYKEGKAYITKDFNEVEVVDYYQGLEEVLKAENNIEFIESKINEIEKKLIKQKEDLGKKYGYMIPITVLPLIPILGFPIAGEILGMDNIVVTPAFGEVSVVNLFGAFGGFFNFVVGLFPSIDSYFCYKYNKDEIVYNEELLEILKNNVEKYNEIILNAKKANINDKDLNDFFIKNIDFDKIQLLNDLKSKNFNDNSKKRIRKRF